MNFLPPLLVDGLPDEPPDSSGGGCEPDPVGSGRPPGGGGRVGADAVGSGSPGRVVVDVGSGSGASSADAEPVDPATSAADSTTPMPARARDARMISPLPVRLTGKRAGNRIGHGRAAPRVAVAGIGAPLRKGAGFSGAPSMRTSKCRWGPVAKPVDPTTPIGWPLRTRSAGRTPKAAWWA